MTKIKKNKNNYHIATKLVHCGNYNDKFGAALPPIYLSTTFAFDSAEQGGRIFNLQEEGYVYTRIGNPTTTVLEKRMAHLEGTEKAIAFSSGMGAIASTFWTLLNATDHLLSSKTIYGGTHSLIEKKYHAFKLKLILLILLNLMKLKKI